MKCITIEPYNLENCNKELEGEIEIGCPAIEEEIPNDFPFNKSEESKLYSASYFDTSSITRYPAWKCDANKINKIDLSSLIQGSSSIKIVWTYAAIKWHKSSYPDKTYTFQSDEKMNPKGGNSIFGVVQGKRCLYSTHNLTSFTIDRTDNLYWQINDDNRHKFTGNFYFVLLQYTIVQ